MHHTRYFEDVKMQVICLELGKKFNNYNPPKSVQFLPAWVLEMPQRSPAVYCGLEPYVGKSSPPSLFFHLCFLACFSF
jgi:hypothetical protein